MSKMLGKKKGWKAHFFIHYLIIFLVLGGSLGTLLLISSDSGLAKGLYIHPNNVGSTKNTIATNGSEQWLNDKVVTAPGSSFSTPPTGMTVSPLFGRYYRTVAYSLGSPITPAFPIQNGWIQFFETGALLLPQALSNTTNGNSSALNEIIRNGIKDSATGIVRLPLLQSLLKAGSRVPVGGSGSSIAYVDLRQSTNPDLMQPLPSTKAEQPQGVFIKGGKRAGKDVGHIVPFTFWSYMNRPDVSPDGWNVDFGSPLTEVLSFTITDSSNVHPMQIQLFSRDGLILDESNTTQPRIYRLNTGIDYLSTFGPPTVTIHAQQNVWAQEETPLLADPASSVILGHVENHFPLTLLGDTRWKAETLWYHVQWSLPDGTRSGWITAATVTFDAVGSAPVVASLDILSPQLTDYLSKQKANVGIALYDLSRQRYYIYNNNVLFIVASSIKVPIMLTFLDKLESEGRKPDDEEMFLLTTMIENSDNDSASELFFNRVGGAEGVARYMRKIGIAGLNPDGDSWGYSTVTPQVMVDLLTDLYEGRLLNKDDQALALDLMQNIESDQRIGVGDTAPNGAKVAMKDGWVTGPDDLWAVNSSGIITAGKETYIVSVYTQEQQSLEDGQGILNQVCGQIASLLT